MIKVKEVSTQIRGVSYKPSDLHNTLNSNSVILLRANNIEDDKLNLNDVVYVDKSKVSSSQYLRIGDILVCASSGSKNLVGKATIIKENIVATFGAFCKVVRPTNILPQFLGYYFTSPKYRNIISDLSAGANINNIRNEHIDSLEIPLPPLEIQKQIADTLDKVTHTIDTCNAILEKLDLLVKSRFIEVFGSITKRRKLEEYADLITKGASPKWQGIDYAEEGTLFVTSENVREGYLDFTKKKYLPNDINKILPRSVLKRNDILINIVNASIGRVAVYDSDELANINQAVALVRLKPNALNITFLLTFLNSEEALRAYDFMKVGGDKANLSLKNISDLLIPVADLELQEKFATFVEQIDKSKLAVKQVLEKAETLKKALMQEYFG